MLSLCRMLRLRIRLRLRLWGAVDKEECLSLSIPKRLSDLNISHIKCGLPVLVGAGLLKKSSGRAGIIVS